MRAPGAPLVGATLVAVACLFARLGALPLLQPDEGRNAEVAREMKDHAEWLVPTYDGLPYLDKPALYFRLVALSMSAFGESETAARLPGAMFGLALLALVYGFARRAYGARAAALAVLVVGTTPLVVAFARIVILDMVLAFFVTAAVLAGYLAEERSGAARSRWYVLGAACSGVAVLVKGPVGFILPLLVLLALQALDRRPGAVRRLFAPRNLLVFLAIVLPWFIALARQRPDFPTYGLVEESLHRFTTPAFHRTAPFWYYAPVIVGVFFPWSVLLPEFLVAGWQARRRWSRADRLLIAWAVVVVLFFSLSQSKLPGYVLTGVVALGVLAARVLDRAFEQPAGPAGRLVLRGAVLLAGLGAAGALFLAGAVSTAGALPSLLHARSAELARLTPVLPPLAWSLAAVALVAALGRWRRDLRVICAALALPPLLLLTVAFGGARAYAEAGSGRALAQRVPALPPGTELACLECLPNGLPFYLRRMVTVVTRDGSETTSNYVVFELRRTADWPPQVVRRAELDRWLAGRDHAVYLLANRASRLTLDSIATRSGARLATLTPDWWAALIAPSRGP
jgi:4-amino-4-deoxy-L-arabinose transferase-like glycosyltransferase